MEDADTAHLTIFWEGTANTLDRPVTTSIGEFYTDCDAVAVNPASGDAVRSALAARRPCLKMGFDGCGVTHGWPGLLCAVGLRSQAATVISCVRLILQEKKRLHLTVLGQSRGAIGAIFLAQQLAAATSIRTEEVELRMLLSDPVPGNLVCTAKLERLACYFCNFVTTANHSMDLRGARHLKRVLALYPHEPLPDCAYHAPVLLEYPHHSAVCEEDVTLGCHQGALFSGDLASELSHVRIATFMTESGVVFRTRSRADAYTASDGWVGGILAKMEGEIKKAGVASRRIAHIHPAGQSQCCKSATIIRRTVDGAMLDEARVFLNQHHLALQHRGGDGRDDRAPREGGDNGGSGGDVFALQIER